jgi:beta-mannosidase
LRYFDVDRYSVLSRITSGEVMARVFAELRRERSTCGGALVWFLQDLWPGAGWGVLDSRGLPKAPFWFLRRILQPIAVFLTDEGVNGLAIHVANDTAAELQAKLRCTLFRDGEVRTASGEIDLVAAPRSVTTAKSDAVLSHFADSSWAYRFGPPGHDLVVVTLLDGERTIARTTRLRDFASVPPGGGLRGSLVRRDDALVAKIETKRFAHAVTIAVPGFVAEDDYFDLAPGEARAIALRPYLASSREPSGTLAAANVAGTSPLTLEEGSS